MKKKKNIPHVTKLLILAENFAGKKGQTFDLSQVNQYPCK